MENSDPRPAHADTLDVRELVDPMNGMDRKAPVAIQRALIHTVSTYHSGVRLRPALEGAT